MKKQVNIYMLMSVKMNPRYPVYIVSKGRWKRRPTASFLEEMDCPYYIIIEESEYSNYAEVIDKDKLLILPQKYLDNYDTFWERAEDNKVNAAVPPINFMPGVPGKRAAVAKALKKGLPGFAL